MKLKRIERGWAGHFCCGIQCQWHRNTLVLDEETGKGIVVSSVGQLPDDLNKNKYIEIGLRRFYETMMFVVEERNGYIEANVRKQIYTPDEMSWCVTDYPEDKTDLQAEKIHEDHVDYVIKEFAQIIKYNEGVGKRWFDRCMEARTLLVKNTRALWLARANRALEKIAWFKLWNTSISTMNPEDGARQEYDKWKKNLVKFLNKFKEYR